jgi:hypothetical protein
MSLTRNLRKKRLPPIRFFSYDSFLVSPLSLSLSSLFLSLGKENRFVNRFRYKRETLQKTSRYKNVERKSDVTPFFP